MKESAERYRRYLETLSPETLDRLREYVTADVHFQDPFNDIHGAEALAKIFHHMFDTLGDVRFSVHHVSTDGDTCLMAWRFEAVLRNRPWSFDGASVVTFAPDGRVAEHIDHWDAARSFYEKLPVIGWLLATLRGRIAVR
jgi:steroid delta-isomerase